MRNMRGPICRLFPSTKCHRGPHLKLAFFRRLRHIPVRGVKEYWPACKMLAYEVKKLIFWPQSPKCCVHLVLATSGPIGRRVWSQGPFQKVFRFFGPFSKTRTTKIDSPQDGRKRFAGIFSNLLALLEHRVGSRPQLGQ